MFPLAVYSTLGQGLQTSIYPGEVIFSIALAILGLILFALLIGNMQVIEDLFCFIYLFFLFIDLIFGMGLTILENFDQKKVCFPL